MAGWAGRRFGATFVPPFEAWGVIDWQGQIIGVVVFNDFHERNVEVSVIGPGAFRKDVIREIGEHCFKTLNCRRATLTTKAGNRMVRNFIERLGGTLEGIKRHYYDDDDAVIYGVLNTEFKYRRQ